MSPQPTPLDPLEADLEAVADPPSAPEVEVAGLAPSDPELVPAAGQETDVWWGAYAGRSLTPMFVLCTLVSVNISLVIGWAWDEDRHDPLVLWHLAVVLIVAVWAFPLFLWVHRSLSYTYRLTTHRLYRDRGFHPPVSDERELGRITQVRVEYATLERPLSVGRVVVEAEGEPPLRLEGVFEPEPVAELIRGWAERARGKVTSP